MILHVIDAPRTHNRKPRASGDDPHVDALKNAGIT